MSVSVKIPHVLLLWHNRCLDDNWFQHIHAMPSAMIHRLSSFKLVICLIHDIIDITPQGKISVWNLVILVAMWLDLILISSAEEICHWVLQKRHCCNERGGSPPSWKCSALCFSNSGKANLPRMSTLVRGEAQSHQIWHATTYSYGSMSRGPFMCQVVNLLESKQWISAAVETVTSEMPRHV
jgi:hypothetical protein